MKHMISPEQIQCHCQKIQKLLRPRGNEDLGWGRWEWEKEIQNYYLTVISKSTWSS